MAHAALVGGLELANTATHAAAGSQALLMYYGFVCTLCASVGASSMQLIKMAWEAMGFQPGGDGSGKANLVLHGVEIPAWSLLNKPELQRAVDFAAMAHAGQFRKTGDPYVAHCIETALIVEQLLSPKEDGARRVQAVTAALLHDVVDDTPYRVDHIQQAFGKGVGRLVEKVSQISSMNQLMRRLQRRQGREMKRETLDEMRDLILQMVDDPIVLLLKLADRLHNMRTVYALRASKRNPVAKETLHVWCPLAERLGLFQLKAELEDLCFAVLQPERYAALRRELDTLWDLSYDGQLPPLCMPDRPASPSPSLADMLAPHDSFDADEAAGMLFAMDDEQQQRHGHSRASSTSSLSFSLDTPSHADSGTSAGGSYLTAVADDLTRIRFPSGISSASPAQMSEEQAEAKALLATVLPFPATRFSSGADGSLAGAGGAGPDRGLGVLVAAARQLNRELALGGHVLGVPVTVQGRLKSLYSIHRKMRRKEFKSVSEVLDARALRLIVDDVGRTQLHGAVMGCYRLNNVVQRLWRPIYAEADDYIANPKRSGYQSLHNAVYDADDTPFEVQIRTESMHMDAEYGSAAHWAYKELPAAASASSSLGSSNAAEPDKVVRPGQPVWRINPESGISDGVVIETDPAGRQLLVATTAHRRYFTDSMVARPQEYRAIQDYVDSKGYFAPGQGDLQVQLELFCLCQDGKYHRMDHCGHKHATTVVPLFRLTEAFAEEAAAQQQLLLAQQQVISENEVDEIVWPGSVTSTGSFDMPYEEVMGLSPLADFHSAHSLEGPSALEGSPARTSSSVTVVTTEPLVAGSPSDCAPAVSNDELAAELRAHCERVNRLRQALEARPAAQGSGGRSRQSLPDEKVMVMVWPTGEVRKVEQGTTAGYILSTAGEISIDADGKASLGASRAGGSRTGVSIGAAKTARRRRAKLVNVNNRLVPESTPLKTGDYVVLSRDVIKI